MRIAHIVPTYFPAVRYGGPIYSVHSLCEALVQAGHEVHVFTTSVDGPNDSNVPHGRPVDLDGVQVHYFRSRWIRRLYYSPELDTHMRSMVGSCDIVHLHSVFLFPTWSGARAARKAGIPYVLSPRGMLVRDLIKRRSSVSKRAWIELIERANLAGAACIHVTSETEREALEELGLALAPTVVIPNGVAPPGPYSPTDLSADVREILGEGVDILSFGRLTWKKELDRLIRAMKDIPRARVLIAGHDEDGLASRLKDVAAQCQVGDRLRLLPRQIDDADKEALFSAARLFALPSLSENFGNVVVEAMIRGVPVVVTADVGAAEIVEASGGGVVSKGGEGGFSEALASLWHAVEQRSTMGAAGAAYVRERLSWPSVATRFEALYRDIAHRDRTRFARSAAA